MEKIYMIGMNLMFNTLMRNTMPVWMLLSALYPIFVGAFVFKALTQMRRLRALRREAAAPRHKAEGVRLRSEAWTEAKDWVPSP
jgi:hypothetical protein